MTLRTVLHVVKLVLTSFLLFVYISIFLAFLSWIVFWYRTKNLFPKEQKNTISYLRSIIDSVPGLMVIVDDKLNYKLVNYRFVEFIGVKEDELCGKPLTDAPPSEFATLVEQFLRSSTPYFQIQMQLNGSTEKKWFITRVSRLSGSSQIAIVSLDIDVYMRDELLILDQKATSENSARLAAIGELAAGIAHEINNPLTVITSKAEQTIRKLQGKQQFDFIPELEKIKTTAFRIANIVRGLKNLSRDGKNESFISWRIADIVQDVTSIIEAKLENHAVRMEVDIDKDIAVECRPTQIGQVIMNLFSNSLDAHKEIKEVNPRHDSWIRISAKEADSHVEIAVTDNGPGIPESIKKKLMTPFFTTKAAGIGTGLGLSISRRIAADHNGEFYLDESSKDTRFILRIPKKQTTPSEV